MELICLFDWECPNPHFKYIYREIFNKLKIKYPEHNITHLNCPTSSNFAGPGGGSNFQIINPTNNKTIVMSFWDRGMDVLNNNPDSEWLKYSIVQYIGGIGMSMTSQEIQETYGVEHIPYQYPLGMPRAYEYVDNFRTEYDPEKKIRKALFMGSGYSFRQVFFDITKNHPLIETSPYIYDNETYFKKLSEYRIAISLNGNGEVCMRDFEAMGLEIPVLRSELFTQFYNPLIPDVHYIKGSERYDEPMRIDMDYPKLTQDFVNAIEATIDDYDKLTRIAKNGREYFDKYCKPDYMVDLFLELANIGKLL